MTQDTKTDYEAIELQIIELFEQLPPDAQSDLLDELIGMTTPNDEDDDDNLVHAHLLQDNMVGDDD